MCPLPKGVTFVLEIAAGEPQAVMEAMKLTRCSEIDLQKAPGFFIGHVLLTPNADSYRILGSNREARYGELRRRMALIMRWLCPDLMGDKPFRNDLSRSLYTKRVTKAWDFIKIQRRQIGSNGLRTRKGVQLGRSGSEAVVANSHNSAGLQCTIQLTGSGAKRVDFVAHLLHIICRHR